MEKLSKSQYEKWKDSWTDFHSPAFHRFGQSFCIDHNIQDPVLYYCATRKRAESYILENFVTQE